jgi:hypothetical protein
VTGVGAPADLAFAHAFVEVRSEGGLVVREKRLGQAVVPLGEAARARGAWVPFSTPITKASHAAGTLSGRLRVVWAPAAGGVVVREAAPPHADGACCSVA